MAFWPELPQVFDEGLQHLQSVHLLPRKLNSLSIKIVRGVLSVNQEVSSAVSLGEAGLALPPPVVPVAKPNALPETPAAWAVAPNSARAATRDC